MLSWLDGVMVHLQQLLLEAAHVWLEDHSEKLGFT